MTGVELLNKTVSFHYADRARTGVVFSASATTALVKWTSNDGRTYGCARLPVDRLTLVDP